MSDNSQHNDPLHIDIVMPHFEVSDFLAQALDSILRQRHSHWTLHFIDDCSGNDQWRQHIHRYQDDPRVHCYQTDRNVGTYRVRNAMLPRLTGPLVTYHDADDVSHEDRFLKQVLAMQQRKADVFGCGYRKITPTGRVKSRRKMVSNANFWMGLGFTFVLMYPTMLTRLEVLRSLNGFDGTARIAADADFVLRASHFFKIGNLRKILYSKQMHPQCLTEAPSTGRGSAMRREYVKGIFQRYKSRKRLQGDELRQAALAPMNDVEFALTQLW